MVILREGICPGINEEFIKALQSEDIKTVEDFVSCNPEELAQKCSLSYKALVAVRRVLLAQYTAFPVSGADLYEELLSSTAILSTGNPSLDKLLDSGLYTGEITELAGSPGSGKTQVCFSVAVNISHQLKQTVFYIDTKGGMCANRLLQMLQSKTPNMEEQMEALQKIKVLRVFDVFSLLACLQNLRSNGLQKASVGGGSVKALMVDSVSAVLSSMLGGKQNEGMSLLMQVAGELKMIARDFSIAVLVTNHVTKDGNGHLKAGLGQSWSHVPRTRVLLQRIEGAETSSLRTATLTKSSRQACHLVEGFDLCHWSEERRTSISGKRKLEERSKP
ncbi:DNA repair protein RAD51 homolog 4 isoform X1 [Sinocyclocheilus rhinocerous]|uniref:DNA repair protein RAD51 homolog 4 n=1 Tax=Sinocyclocheilus rhinocerous TaxID=307959 RepID=A0A673GQX4_9TELE|nr:PREDICTED: DNA repair protein RAD51 homolog 4 isoform X1 [Sinocyclocheilus rhinocerous]XP_016371043.1 PREDICTED: DNA repair protein RAD51 homolog 4 isoform X1 [Sinocyclocheilus rhinocerous]